MCSSYLRDSSKHPIMHRKVPYMNYPAKNVNSAQIEDNWFQYHLAGIIIFRIVQIAEFYSERLLIF
jgi:hypothetical protein